MELLLSLIKAFAVGGVICVFGQILVDRTKLTPARILVLFLLIGVLAGAVGLYKPLVEFAGAGATLPISGFGYALVEGVKESVKSDGLIGIIKGGLTATSAGIALVVIAGFLIALVAKPKDKS